MIKFVENLLSPALKTKYNNYSQCSTQWKMWIFKALNQQQFTLTKKTLILSFAYTCIFKNYSLDGLIM